MPSASTLSIKKENVIIGPASEKDVGDIALLISYFYGLKLMLARSEADILASLPFFTVAKYLDPSGKMPPRLVGCSAIYCYSEFLGELRSLGVHPDYQGIGLGKALVGETLSHAKKNGLTKVFTLTMEIEFFKRCGFHEVDKEVLPEKIWKDCLGCGSFPSCHETALSIEF
jgi:amino-acid N-acetyltransferase